MKNVTYMGQEFENVPDEVKFVAADWDGYVCGFTVRPNYSDGVWSQVRGTSVYHLGDLANKYPCEEI